MESQPQNPEFSNNPEIFYPCILTGVQLTMMRSVQIFACCWVIFQASLLSGDFVLKSFFFL